MPSIHMPVDEIVVNIKNFIDHKTATYEDSTIKLIPRIILEDHDNSYCPNGLTRKDYKSDTYLNVESKLIKALGEACDNNPKVAFVQMGILGEYGEFYPGG